MKLPRFRLAWLMVFVAFAAVNFGVIRVLMGYRPNTHTGETLIVGALPIANVLVVGLLIGQRRRGSRRFLWGFEVFGVMALALHIAMAILSTGELLQSYLDLGFKPIVEAIGGRRRRISFDIVPIVILAYSAIAIRARLPQLTSALIGGWRCRSLKTAEQPGCHRC